MRSVKILKTMLTECLLSCQRWKEDLQVEREKRKKGRIKKEGRTQKKMQEGRTKRKETNNTGH